MRQNLYKKSALFVSSIGLSGAVFSASVDKDELANECKYLGASLSQLSNANTKEHCSVDVSYSGVMMEQSAALIKENRIQFALDNLGLVYRTLERARSNHECRYFSSMMMPYLEKADTLARELTSIPHDLAN
ncbi:hypothetical protein Lsan_0407 [Legionella santicrucis]|uniref:Uncharacterized protein n=1 Tax=Legionella santicrucis TaxID=45074 RepID=A0A0W0ZCD9_9GAMM|nr:hypothetical protein [Legionella santicrucis]KTD66462.1 hypothetical protein Lsan_0407 [Legionella santicrucis]